MKRHDISNIEVCLAYRQYKKDPYNSPFPYEILAKKFECPEKIAYSACERACDSNYIEYGVSLRTGWLTEKGENLLKDSSLT